MSGIALIAVAGLWFWCRRVFPKGSAVSRAALLSLAFLLLEALLGAGLVLFQYVGGNVSTGRAIYLAAHLTNTQLLLACLTATAYLVGRRSHASFDPTRVPTILKAALSVILLVSITGVIAALGDTLYPSTSLAAGLRQDFSGTTSLLLRLRALHPALAIGAAAYLVYAALRFVKTDALQQPAIAVMTLAVAQLCAGAINVALLAPIWMQIVHLLLADLLWIALVLVGLGCAAGDYAETRAVPAVL
jgi:heme A synthase